MKKTLGVVISISISILTGCSYSLPTDKSSQLDYACTIINGWPGDYATIWPTAVKKHNESPETVSAADYMTGYIQAASGAFGINDPEAIDLVGKYKLYWNLLETDYILGGGVLPTNPTSTEIVSDLMKHCDDIGRGFKP